MFMFKMHVITCKILNYHFFNVKYFTMKWIFLKKVTVTWYDQHIIELSMQHKLNFYCSLFDLFSLFLLYVLKNNFVFQADSYLQNSSESNGLRADFQSVICDWPVPILLETYRQLRPKHLGSHGFKNQSILSLRRFGNHLLLFFSKECQLVIEKLSSPFSF